MKIEFTVPFRRVPSPLALVVEPAPDPQSNPPRIARLLALAHKLDALVRSGAVTGYAELARLGHISPARLTQILVLLHLAPSIQEYLLFLSAADARFIGESGLRKIAREPRWDRQRQLFAQHLQK
jgi:Tat protein secretion system quality control protein TatD with DNase activity